MWLSSPIVLKFTANNKRGGRRGTTKRSAQRRNAGPMSSSARQNYAKIPTMGLGRTIPVGFPDQLMAKLRYHDSQALSSISGSIAKYVYLWNSTYDPDYTGVGHQPLYRDTFAGIYDQYSVVSATCKITFVNTSSVPYLVGAVIDDDVTTSTTRDTLCEQTHGKHFLVPALTGSLSSKTFTMTWDCKKILNIDPFTSEAYKTPIGSNPAEQSILTLWSTPFDGVTSSALAFDIEFEQTVLWTELQTPISS